MKTTFAKTLIKSLFVGTFIMGAFGLAACSDDSSSGGSSNEDTSGTTTTVSSQQDASIVFSSLTATSAGTKVKLTGSISLNFTDTLNSSTPENLQFTGLDIQAGILNNGSLTTISGAEPTYTISDDYFPRTGAISLTEMGILFDLENAALTECGEYNFAVTAYATDGTKDFQNTQTVAFTRSDIYCQVESSSSEEEETAEIEMEICSDITLTTNTLPGLDLASCTAVESTTADIVIVKSSGDFNITSGNGTLFSPIDNETLTSDNTDDYFVGYWPEDVKDTVYMSDFKYKAITGTSIDKFVENDDKTIYVAKTPDFDETTGAGFFAFGVTTTEGNNSDYTVVVKVYRAK